MGLMGPIGLIEPIGHRVLWHWVVAGTSPWVASEDSPDGEP